MKNLAFSLLAVFALVFTSCSSDDDNGGGSSQVSELKATINGTALTFNTVVVDKETYTEGTETYTELDVTATIGTDTSKIFSFYLEVGDLGADALDYLYYVDNGVQYSSFNSQNFNSVVSVNDGSNFAMTFSGTLTGYDDNTGETITITIENGSITAAY
ncbi:hypothetical protein [Lacinutrix salivirga]